MAIYLYINYVRTFILLHYREMLSYHDTNCFLLNKYFDKRYILSLNKKLSSLLESGETENYSFRIVSRFLIGYFVYLMIRTSTLIMISLRVVKYNRIRTDRNAIIFNYDDNSMVTELASIDKYVDTGDKSYLATPTLKLILLNMIYKKCTSAIISRKSVSSNNVTALKRIREWIYKGSIFDNAEILFFVNNQEIGKEDLHGYSYIRRSVEYYIGKIGNSVSQHHEIVISYSGQLMQWKKNAIIEQTSDNSINIHLNNI